MRLYFQFALLGLGIGALYAAIAQGLILAHRGAGVINFAHGAMAMYIAYVFKALRDGNLIIPPLLNPLALVEGVASWFGASLDLPSWPTSIDLGGPVGSAPAFALAMVHAALLGLAVHFLVFRPLRTATALAKAVASVGIALVLQAVVVLRFGPESVHFPPLLPTDNVTLFGITIPVDRYVLCGLVIVLSFVLMAVYRFTRVGLSTRAAAENERAAMFIGLSPDRLAGFNWVLSSMIAGAAGIMFASVTGLNPTDLVLVVIPALGAALLARLESFTVALAAGIGIGVLQSLTLPLQTEFSWFPRVGAAAGIPFIVIFIAMILRGDKLPQRGAPAEIRLPPFDDWLRPGRTALVLCPLVVLGLIFLPFDFRGGLLNSLAGVVMALSLVVIVGMAGQISLMQMTIAGIAGLAMTRLAGDWDLPFLVAPALAIAVAVLAGTLAGFPALRVRGVHLAVLTLGAAYTFQNMVFANRAYLRVSDGSGSVPPPSAFGLDFGVNSDFPFGAGGVPSAWFGLFLLVIVVLCCWGVIRLRRSDVGLRFLALRANEKAATALGVNVARTKLLAFGIGAALAGLAGVLSTYRFEGIAPEQYDAMQSISALAVAYLGGITMVPGAIIAGLLAVGGLNQVIVERLFHAGQFRPLMEGLGVIVVAVLHNEGIASALQQLVKLVKHRVLRIDAGSGPPEPDGEEPHLARDVPPAPVGAASAALRASST